MTLFNISFKRRVGLGERAVFTRQLAAMVEAGISLVKALNMIADQTSNKQFAAVIFDISRRLEEGENLSVALSHYSDVFPKLYISAIRAAEASGRLQDVLKELAIQQEDDNRFISSIRNAVVYPIFIIVAMIVVGFILTIVVIPKLESLFADSQTPLPFTTMAFIATAKFLQRYWYIILIIIAGIIYSLRLYSKTKNGKYFFDNLIINLPGFSGLIKGIYMARFARTFSMLIKSGVPIIDSITIVSDMLGNEVYKSIFLNAASQLERGIPLSTPISKSKEFPSVVGQMVLAGEQTGKLDEILLSMAQYYKEDSDSKIKLLSSLVEPALIIVVGLGVAFIVFSIMLPIYQIAGTIQ